MYEWYKMLHWYLGHYNEQDVPNLGQSDDPFTEMSFEF